MTALSDLTEVSDGTLVDLRTLTLEDFAPDHPIRQEHAHLTVKVAELEGKLAAAAQNELTLVSKAAYWHRAAEAHMDMHGLYAARVDEALERLERESQHSSRHDRVGQLLEGLGCILTGRSSSWSPEGGWPLP